MEVQASQEKIETVQTTIDLLKNYEIIAAADLYKVNSAMLQDIRRKLRDRLSIKVIKNTLMQISFESADKDNFEEFMDQIAGPNVFLFTNGNPFKLAMELDANKVKVFAKPGDIAMEDIVLSAGNTGLSPGPLIGKFGALAVRTRIESGNIWIVQDTTVCRKGEMISEDLTDLLQRMGIRAAEMGLSIKAVYEKGTIIPGEDLLLNPEEYKTNLTNAFNDAFRVAVEASYYTPQTIPVILAKAARNAKAVAIEAGYASKETISELITKANAQARFLASKVGKKMAE